MRMMVPFAVTDANLVSNNVAETEAAIYNPGTIYGLGALMVSAHRVYESLQAGNLGHAATELAWWLDLGPTNAWAMFDQSNGSATSNPELISVTVQTDGRINSVAVLNIKGTSLRIRAEVASGSPGVWDLLYDETFSLVSTTGIDNWYDYFFTDIVMLEDYVITDLPLYNDLRVTIDIMAPGGTASVGNMIVARARSLGGTTYGAKTGIIDYSRKGADDFGSYTIVERAYSRRGSFTVWIDAGQVDAVAAILTDYRAIPVLWMGTDEYASTYIFGFFRDWSTEIAYPTYSICTLEIEGLT